MANEGWEVSDIMNIRSEMMTSLLSTVLSKALKKELGQDVDISIGDVSIRRKQPPALSGKDGKTSIHLNVNASISDKDLRELLLGLVK